MATATAATLDFTFILSKPPSLPAQHQWTGLRMNPSSSFSLSSSFPSNYFRLGQNLSSTSFPIRAVSHQFQSQLPIPLHRPIPSTVVCAGRSKKKPGGSSSGRIEGSGEVRRQAKDRARLRSRRLAENLFYRRNKRPANQADSFTEDELQAIGLGYDRAVRFMSKDDPNLRHPYDWYKYGRYGPYSWRGIVVGPPIRGRFSDERVTLIDEVRTQEEWEEIEQFDMATDYCRHLDSAAGLRYYWVFVRHPKWRPTELPWQQWTLAAEVAMEAGSQRLDKWSLMGRLGNRVRSMITQCAAWMRPDIIYVKRPVYQCRFEPQDDFFKLLGPLLDPSTENGYPCELQHEDGRIEVCTYFGGLCKIVKSNPKAYVDDVVKAYQKLSDEGKSRCLEFLLTNHPMELLHPYTKEWKAKLEEMELGCDAPDDNEDDNDGNDGSPILDWIEESDNDDDEEEEADEDEEVIDVGEEEQDDKKEMETNPEETQEYWDDLWKKAVRSSDEMEKLVKRSIKLSNRHYNNQMLEMQQRKEMSDVDDQSTVDDESTADVSLEDDKEEWIEEEVNNAGYAAPKRTVRSKIPPELFLRASVRPFTYRNLVKEVVLMRHAIIDGDITVG
ncbi:hypothetical protein Cni_G08417 [Canna indica]|uniref:Uncharacterized protein n=1 Tax=Canna indica TaxID=4628 RepID=A0AAQ3Q5R1_9LILI|nr:hypothetical protein Cni_G08417 [Canna indica]